MNRLTIVLVTLLLAGCASIFHRGERREPLQLCVRNSTVGYGNVVAHAGLIRFDVMPGQEQCKRIAEISGSQTITARTTAGGTTGPLSYATELNPGGSRCWRWELDNTRASQVRLLPCDL